MSETQAGFELEPTLHAVLRFMERKEGSDFSPSVDHLGYAQDEFLSSADADQLREIAAVAKPFSLQDGLTLFQSGPWILVVDLFEGVIVTVYQL